MPWGRGNARVLNSQRKVSRPVLTPLDTKFDLVLFGAGKMADVMTVYLDHFSDYNIVAYAVDREFYSPGAMHNDRPIVPWEDLEQFHKPGEVKLMGPVSYRHMNQFRRDKYYDGKARGYEYGSFIHPAAHVMTDKIGDHVIIMEQNVIQPFVEIGNNVVIWSDSHLGHHTKVGDHCFMSAYVGVSGCVTIGEECFLAGQTGVANDITIGDRCALLNHAPVKTNLPDDTVMVGPEGEIKRYPSGRIQRLI